VKLLEKGVELQDFKKELDYVVILEGLMGHYSPPGYRLWVCGEHV
jgi:hypothetical protein